MLDAIRAQPTISVSVEAEDGHGAGLGAEAVPLGRGSAFRVAPMLASLQTSTESFLVVGQVRVVSTPAGTLELEAVVRGLWTAVHRSPKGTAAGVQGWRGISDHAAIGALVADWVRAALPEPDTTADARATAAGKAIAEQSRNSVERARRLRYALELRLSDTIRGTYKESLDTVLADLVELSVITSRARDEAREAAREGMWAWRSNPSAYHAQRKLRDPSLPTRSGDRAARRKPWFASYDAAVRHCERTEELLGEELHLLQGLLSAASAIATARDAQAQERFTLTATVGGVALGVPALIVGLYGVSTVVPLHFDLRSAEVIGSLSVASLFACVLAFITTPGPLVRRLRHAGITLVAVSIMMCLVGAAGYYFPAVTH
jgi:hypothetical protein